MSAIPDLPVAPVQVSGILRLFSFWGSRSPIKSPPLLSPSLPSDSTTLSSIPISLPSSAITLPFLPPTIENKVEVDELSLIGSDIPLSGDESHKLDCLATMEASSSFSSSSSLSSSSHFQVNRIGTSTNIDEKDDIRPIDDKNIPTTDSDHDGVLLSVSWKNMMSVDSSLSNALRDKNTQLYSDLHRCVVNTVRDVRPSSYSVGTSSSASFPTSPALLSSNSPAALTSDFILSPIIISRVESIPLVPAMTSPSAISFAPTPILIPSSSSSSSSPSSPSSSSSIVPLSIGISPSMNVHTGTFTEASRSNAELENKSLTSLDSKMNSIENIDNQFHNSNSSICDTEINRKNPGHISDAHSTPIKSKQLPAIDVSHQMKMEYLTHTPLHLAPLIRNGNSGSNSFSSSSSNSNNIDFKKNQKNRNAYDTSNEFFSPPPLPIRGNNGYEIDDRPNTSQNNFNSKNFINISDSVNEIENNGKECFVKKNESVNPKIENEIILQNCANMNLISEDKIFGSDRNPSTRVAIKKSSEGVPDEINQIQNQKKIIPPMRFTYPQRATSKDLGSNVLHPSKIISSSSSSGCDLGVGPGTRTESDAFNSMNHNHSRMILNTLSLPSSSSVPIPVPVSVSVPGADMLHQGDSAVDPEPSITSDIVNPRKEPELFDKKVIEEQRGDPVTAIAVVIDENANIKELSSLRLPNMRKIDSRTQIV